MRVTHPSLLGLLWVVLLCLIGGSTGTSTGTHPLPYAVKLNPLPYLRGNNANIANEKHSSQTPLAVPSSDSNLSPDGKSSKGNS